MSSPARAPSDVETNGPRGTGRWSRVLASSVLLGLVLSLVGCTEDGQDRGPEQRSGSVRAEVSLGEVTGQLARKRRTAIKRVVGSTVDAWIDAAYVPGSYPRARFDGAFGAFTRDAVPQARRDRALLTNRVIAQRLSDVQVRRRQIVVDVLARGGRPVGATARVVVAQRLRGTKIDRVERITGQLSLTPTKRGWQIFAYDLERGRLR